MIVKVARYRSKPQRKQASTPRSIKVVKPTNSQEEKLAEIKSSLIVRQVRNVRPLTPASALLMWNALFQTGVV